ncbi:hypothetical protein L7F22_000072 [Adiantum nelumboides]|nr:hypothetical protein [Adiantum nelumboides]
MPVSRLRFVPPVLARSNRFAAVEETGASVPWWSGWFSLFELIAGLRSAEHDVEDDGQGQHQRAEDVRTAVPAGVVTVGGVGARLLRGQAPGQADQLGVRLRGGHHRDPRGHADTDDERRDRAEEAAGLVGQREHLGAHQDVDDHRRGRAGQQADPGRRPGHPLPEQTEDEDREQRRVEEAEQRLDVVHQVRRPGRDERGADREHAADDRDQPADAEVVAVGAARAHPVLPDVVGEHRVERADVRRHAGHERGQQTGDRDAEDAVREQLLHQQRQRVVVGDAVDGVAAARLHRGDLRDQDPGDHARDHDDEHDQRLRERADDRGAPRGGHRLGRQCALDLGEVRRPVAEGQHEPEPEHDAQHRQDRVRDLGERGARPGVQVRTGARALGDRAGQAVPATDPVEPGDGQRDQQREDHEELQDLGVDRRRQPAEGDVAQDDDGGDRDRDRQRPAEQRLQHQAQREQVDARDQDRGDREDHRLHPLGGPVEPLEQELGDAAGLGAVVERHHHDAEEHHRRDGAEPVVVHGRDAVLRPVGDHADELDGAEVGRDERQPGDPRRHRPAGQQEVQAGGHRASCREADPEHEDEVEGDQQVVDQVRVEAQDLLGGHAASSRDVPGARRAVS